MPQTPQTYKSHIRWFPPFHFFVVPVMLLNFLNSARHLWMSPSASTAFACLVAFALIGVAVLPRVMAVAVQDRVIRLEMHLRMRDVLPADLRGRINELTPDQLCGLRFASDAELPDLVRQVLGGSLTKRKDIKLKIKNWQGDYLRA